MEKPDILAQLSYVLEISEIVEPVLKYLELNEVIIFEIYDVLKEMTQKILMKIMDAKDFAAVFRDKTKLKEKCLAEADVRLSSAIITALNKKNATPDEIEAFKKNYISNLLNLAKLFLNCEGLNSFYKHVRSLAPKNIRLLGRSESCECLVKTMEIKVDMDKLGDELELLRIDPELKNNEENDPF